MIGVLLAGGKSTRFGEDKAIYTLDGKPMYEHVIEKMKNVQAIDEIVINTNDKLKGRFNAKYKVIIDDPNYKDMGPLSGIYRAAVDYPDQALLVMSVDTPYVEKEWLNQLTDSAKHSGLTTITSDDEHLHPLIGVYQSENLSEKLKAQLDSKRLSMKAFFENIDINVLDVDDYDFDKEMLVNINRKSDIK